MCVVVKDVESLPEKSDVMKAVELCLGKWEPGARVKGAAKQFNVWLSDPLVIPPPSGFHRTWTLLCPRSPHEVFRIKRRAQDASRQVRKFGASKNIHGFLVLGTTDEFVVRPAMEYIARDARRFRDLAAVMIDLPGTWLGKPQRRYIDYLGIWKNPASAKRLTSKLGVKAVGAAGHIQRDMVEPDGIPCYRVMSSEGRHVNRVHLPDIRWIKPEDLD